jgi:predicted GIY-YIG superfamily endonuclease
MAEGSRDNPPIRGRSIRMFLVDGTPTGLIVGEIVNWSGKAIVVPRTVLPTFLKRKEAQNTAVYLLSGQDPDDPFRLQVYVGETEDIGRRLREHDSDEKKDFFDRATVFLSKDENLTRAHARRLEEQLEVRIRSAGRTTLMQGNTPGGSSLPEADISDMDYFLDQIEIILPVLGLDILRSVATTKRKDEIRQLGQLQTDHQFTFEIGNVKANGIEVDGEFIVKARSLARDVEAPAMPATYKAIREKLKADGSLSPSQDQMLVFTRDVPFSSPSAAACVVYGASISGPANWKVSGTGTTYAEVRKKILDVAESASLADAKDEAET